MYRRSGARSWPGWRSAPAAAQTEPVPGQATFTIFVRGTDVGREQVSVARSGSQWIITSTGRLGDFTLNRCELIYAADWQPIELHVEGTQAAKPGDKGGAQKSQLDTSFSLTSAINEITQNGAKSAKTDVVSVRTIVMPSNVFAGYEVLAARLANADLGAEFQTYVAANAEVKVTVKGISDEAVTTPSGIINTRKYELMVNDPGAAVHDDGLGRSARSPRARRHADGQPERRPRRSCRGIGANAHGEEPDRLGRHHPGQRLQHRGHSDAATDPWTAAASNGRARGRVGPGRS